MTELRAWVPGTAGEIVQGWLDGEAVQITAPINIGSTAIFQPTANLRVAPHLPKVFQALDQLAKRYERTITGTFHVQTALPTGKGFGSSTADIVASLAVAAESIDLVLSARDLADIALAVEPTDGVMFDGMVLWGQRNGNRLESLGTAPACEFFIDAGIGHVNTARFAARDRWTAESERMTVRALEMVKDGMAHNDLHAIGEAASLSAAAHQRLLFKPDLEAFQELGTAIGASGCCIGHSGTLLGLLVDPTTVDVQAAFDWLSARWHHPLRQVTLIDGGVRVVRSATLPV